MWQCDNCGDENLSVVRAHYHQPGNVLHARRHKMNGEVVFSSGGFLTNLGVERSESILFCEEEPVGSDCVRVPIPDCAQYAAKPSCSILFYWSFNGAAIRLRRTGTKLWAENQDPNNPSSWGFTSAGWLDASGGLGVPDAEGEGPAFLATRIGAAARRLEKAFGELLADIVGTSPALQHVDSPCLDHLSTLRPFVPACCCRQRDRQRSPTRRDRPRQTRERSFHRRQKISRSE